MAGYNNTGIQKNGSLINDQADRQRSKFGNKPNNPNGVLGVADIETINNIFSHTDNSVGESAEARFDEIVSTMKSLDNKFQTERGANPDFPQGIDLDYFKGMESPDLSALPDKPNKLGPNISVPQENTFSPSQERQDVQVPTRSSDGGFGYKIDRNNRPEGGRADADRLGTYFNRFYNEEATPVKGEFEETPEIDYQKLQS